MGMQEAFRKAVGRDPRSEFSDQVRNSDREIAANRREENQYKQLERLKGKWLKIGKQWFYLEVEVNLWTNLATNKRELRREFLNACQAIKSKSEEQIASCLIQLAEGMGISEEKLHPTYRESIASWVLKNPLQQIQYELKPAHLSHPARTFVGQFASLAGYSEDQLKELDNFIHHNAGLPGKIRLADAAIPLARWVKSQHHAS